MVASRPIGPGGDGDLPAQHPDQVTQPEALRRVGPDIEGSQAGALKAKYAQRVLAALQDALAGDDDALDSLHLNTTGAPATQVQASAGRHLVLVPTTPQDGKKQIVNGKGTGHTIEKADIPRTRLILDALAEENIHIPEEDIIRGEVEKRTMRRSPYNAIIIRALNRTVIVCDEGENTTFIAYSSENPERYYLANKYILRARPDVAKLDWDADIEIWKRELFSLVTAEHPPKKNPGKEPFNGKEFFGDTAEKTVEMDQTYFNNADNVRYDLESYASALSLLTGEDQTPLDLNTGNIRLLQKIKCKNGELIDGNTYLLRAGKALGIAENRREANNKVSDTLKALWKIAGLEVPNEMDEQYFGDNNNVAHDFQAFAEAYNTTTGQNKAPLELNMNNIRTQKKVPCNNGERVDGHTYLTRGAIRLKYAKNKKEAQSKFKITFEQLQEIFKRAQATNQPTPANSDTARTAEPHRLTAL